MITENKESTASDLAGVPENVVAICNVAWTPAVVEAYQASQVQPE